MNPIVLEEKGIVILDIDQWQRLQQLHWEEVRRRLDEMKAGDEIAWEEAEQQLISRGIIDADNDNQSQSAG